MEDTRTVLGAETVTVRIGGAMGKYLCVYPIGTCIQKCRGSEETGDVKRANFFLFLLLITRALLHICTDVIIVQKQFCI